MVTRVELAMALFKRRNTTTWYICHLLRLYCIKKVKFTKIKNLKTTRESESLTHSMIKSLYHTRHQKWLKTAQKPKSHIFLSKK
ncbi:hypothetical protein OFO01_03575 [Campylobacter sp. JMF_01 NE2]|uniref:hypothetical protein n=1 Tax=unclassified Campylobacter TaxID=2593542 RepID=UPI0022E9DD1A|nr:MULTISPECIES: hypothetical protein [unclassified Campylobacter]MDA3052525.1 hypothetical protein [Campylobacter sp. JMF_03 NE3]MDA3062501.1 hypothetical protein [Campylobacter sp. JMF_14 EL1]MDA3066857.1 hypothetical protein [Campylobacter sp. JMF_01 NE2]MDA3073380.1 hypothetical protein [Campylobacter sp. JMF_10 EL2]